MMTGGSPGAGIGGIYKCSYPMKRGTFADSNNFGQLIWQYLQG